MKTYISRGPFGERPYFTEEEIERLCAEELAGVGLYPASPEPIRIERFVEKRFGVTPTYEQLPDGVLGWTVFDEDGVTEIAISRGLAEEGRQVAERRINTTLAHESGHGLLHGHLFALHGGTPSLFEGDEDVSAGKVLCREQRVLRRGKAARYDGRWWEYQANRVMAALLLPVRLVHEALDDVLVETGGLAMKSMPAGNRHAAMQILVDTFDVNPIVARIRLDYLYKETDERQLTL